MLEVEGLSAWYGEARVLGDVTLSVKEGEVVTLVGRNGAGKTTLLRSVMGLHRHIEGVVRLDGTEINHKSPDARARAGLGWVPDDRGIYASLTVLENLLLPPVVHPDAWSLEQVYEAFPALADRRCSMGTQLSGGEQQMLAIARATIAKPKMILLDEPSEGIMPVLVEEMGVLFRRLRDQGVTLLLVEQNVEWALRLADRAIIMDQGEVVYESSSAALLADKAIQERYCAV